jgi:hypothetical protein
MRSKGRGERDSDDDNDEPGRRYASGDARNEAGVRIGRSTSPVNASSIDKLV